MNRWIEVRPGRAAAVLILAILTATVAACDSLLGTDKAAFANRARVLVEGNTPVPLAVVTSTNFVATTEPLSGEQLTTLFFADTANVPTLPFDRTYDIRGRDRFLVRIVNPDLNQTATIHIRVFLDDREVYSEHATMRDASLQYIAFYQP